MSQAWQNTLRYHPDKCIGCGICASVCPHAVFSKNDQKAVLVSSGSCMECGACQINCPQGAIQVDNSVGCAFALMRDALFRKYIRAWTWKTYKHLSLTPILKNEIGWEYKLSSMKLYCQNQPTGLFGFKSERTIQRWASRNLEIYRLPYPFTRVTIFCFILFINI